MKKQHIWRISKESQRKSEHGTVGKSVERERSIDLLWEVRMYVFNFCEKKKKSSVKYACMFA